MTATPKTPKEKGLEELEAMAAKSGRYKRRTPEQRARMSDAQRLRWARYWQEKDEDNGNE